MKTRITLIAIFFIPISFIGCKKEDNKLPTTPKEIKLPANSVQLISNGNKFGIDLFNKVAKVDDSNLMLSPVSANIALSMLLNGCDGNTFTQIRDMLGYNSLTTEQINEVYKSLVSQLLSVDPSVKLAIANSVWSQKGFAIKDLFKNGMKDNYDARIESLDFSLPSTLQTINKWASDNTYGKIPKVLDEISPDLVMFLMNALYFKGDWSYQFDISKTQNEIFNLSDGNQINVQMMHLTADANVFNGDDYKALELFYGRRNFSMIVILPNSNISDFYSELNENSWNSLTNFLTNASPISELQIALPRFKFSYERKLNEVLIDLGMSDAFNPSLADLSGISESELFVDFVKQNTFVEVNETGTEAAAVTTVGVGITSAGPINQFIVDKPFVFIIRERTTNTILFIGKVINPNI